MALSVMTSSQTNNPSTQQTPSDLLASGGSLGAAPNGEEGLLVQVTEGNEALHISFADFHVGYVGQYIQLADAKAAATFAVAAGLLGYMLDKGAFGVIAKPAFEGHFILATIIAIALVTSSALSFVVIVPRQQKSRQDGFVFWGAVAQISTAGEFIKRVTSTTSAGLVQARLAHCYDLSRVCARKYAVLRLSMLSGAVGVAAALMLILVTEPQPTPGTPASNPASKQLNH